MSEVLRFRLDDLRRFSVALGAGVGVLPARASALALQLLWFDAAGAPSFGMSTFPDWLERIDRRAVDPVAEGKVAAERTGTAVLDGQNGIPSLVLARAGELAIEKARDAGVGLVRVINAGSSGPAASVAAEMAVGPFVGPVDWPGIGVEWPSRRGRVARHLRLSALAERRRGSSTGVAPWGNVLAPMAAGSSPRSVSCAGAVG